MKYSTTQIEEGIKLHKIDTSKFKTNLISIFLTTKLNREDITKKALILAILRRGTNNLKTQEEINTKLEELYGAELNCGIDKLGDDHVMKFYIETLNDNFTYKKENILKESIELLFDIVFNPLTENNRFKEEYILSEKQNLKQIIEAKKDNKANYAYIRCLEEMYKNQPYGLFTYGYPEDIDKITNQELYETYQELIETCKIDIFVSGNLLKTNINTNQRDVGICNIDKIISNCIKSNQISPRDANNLYINNETKAEVKEKVIKESMDVAQGKLVIGLDVIDCIKEEKPAVSVYNAILGGGANSKLFQNVREKASLAYSAGSLYIKNKNNIIIKSGIEHSNYDKALEIIEKQLEDMKAGNFTETDIKDAKEVIISSFKSMQDEQDSEISYIFGKEMEQSPADVEAYLKQIESISKEQIIKIANKIKINTIYFLTNKA